MATSSRTFKVLRPIWERSLYWRSVLGFSACIAAILAVQATAVVVWLKSAPDNQRLSAFTHSVSADLGAALEASPTLDVQRYVDTHYVKPLASLFIVIE